MPYIKKEDRPYLDTLVHLFMDEKFKGKLNYFIFKFTKEYVKQYGESYGTYRDIIGELEMCKLEIYRKMCSLYENKKEKENGAVE